MSCTWDKRDSYVVRQRRTPRYDAFYVFQHTLQNSGEGFQKPTRAVSDIIFLDMVAYGQSLLFDNLRLFRGAKAFFRSSGVITVVLMYSPSRHVSKARLLDTLYCNTSEGFGQFE